jgi:hypothetical protein
MRSQHCTTLEKLEQRRLLAGNVAVAYDPITNTISVEGGQASEQLRIFGDATTGYDVIGLGTTTINGAASVHINTPSLANFDIDLGKGNDYARLEIAAANVTVEMGQGDDLVEVVDSFVANGLHIELGKGNDVTVFSNNLILNGLWLEAGQGNDVIGFVGNPTTVATGNSHLEGGPGNDVIVNAAGLVTTAGTEEFENF